MRLLAWAAAVAAACLSASALAAPLEAYGKLPTIETAAIAADGSKFAAVLTNGEARSVLIRNLTTGRSEVLSAGSAKVRELEWAGSRHLLITVSTTATIMDVLGPRREYSMVQAFDTETRKTNLLMDDVAESLNVVYGAPAVRTIEGRPVVFLQGIKFVDSVGRLALFRADLTRGKTAMIHQGFRETNDWLVDGAGEPFAQTEFDAKTGRWALRVNSNGAWKPVLTGQSFEDGPEIWGLGRDGRTILVGMRKGDEVSLHELAGGADKLSDEMEVEANESPIYDPASHHLIGFRSLVGDDLRYRFFDPKDQSAWNAIKRAYPGQTVSLVSWSANRRRMIVHVESPTEGPAYAFIDLDRGKAEWIGNQYQSIAPEDISPVKPIAFKAADGTALTGYLTLPRGRGEKGLPLVVLPHGGPAARDTLAFDFWSQAMASRGYAVLQVNFRGSSGLGVDFMQAGYGQWGRKMQTDLSDGVRWLAAEGTIDPKRVCIVGASYGGYAALAGVALDPEPYRCAASVAGLSDMRKFILWARAYRGQSAFRYWSEFVGAENMKDAVLQEISPAALVDRIKAPILLVHGKDDTVVPLEQSRIMAEALKKAGKPVEFVTLNGDDHWLSRGETRLQMLTSVVAFLEKHNPPN